MMAKIPRVVLLDVNVWLDNYLPGRPSSPASRSLLSWLDRHGVDIVYPITAPGTVFYLLGQAMKRAASAAAVPLKREDAEAIRDIAWACVDNMSELGTPVGADESDLWLARKYRRLHSDLEDDLVLAAAERAQADYLVTSDEALLRKAMVPALSPEDFVRVVCAA